MTLALILQTQGSPTGLTLKKSGSLNVPAKNLEIPLTELTSKDTNAADAGPLPNILASGAANFESLKDTNTLAPKVRNQKCFWPSFYDDYYVPPPPPPYPGHFGPLYPPMRGPPPYPFF